MPTAKPTGQASSGNPWGVHKRFDKTLKQITDRAPAAMLAWLVKVLGLPATTLVQPSRSKELVLSEQAVDALWLVEVEGEQELLHLEFQLEDETRMGHRLAAYAVQLNERDKLPVHSVVLYLREKAVASLPPFVIGTKRKDYLRYDFDAIKMWEVDPETVLAQAVPTLWPLAAMMGKMSPARVLGVAEQIINAVSSVEEQKDLVGMLVVLAGIQFTDAEIASALRRNAMVDEIWEMSDTAQAQRARGHAEGHAEGHVEGVRDVTRAALERRFGSLDEDVLAAISEADEPTLTEIVAEIVARPNETLDEVRARLKSKS